MSKQYQELGFPYFTRDAFLKMQARAETAEAKLAGGKRLLGRFASHLGAGLSGKTGDDMRDCIYCHAEFVFGKRAKHDPECPILQARAFLDGK